MKNGFIQGRDGKCYPLTDELMQVYFPWIQDNQDTKKARGSRKSGGKKKGKGDGDRQK